MAIRAVNTAGTATTGIVVNGVNIGDADFGYTTVSAARAASEAGDTIVFTEAMTDATQILIVIPITVTAADNVRHDGVDPASGARVAITGGAGTACLVRHSEGVPVVENLVFVAESGSSFQHDTADADVLVRRCIFTNSAATGNVHYARNIRGTTTFEFCLFIVPAIRTANGFDVMTAERASAGHVTIRNCTILALGVSRYGFNGISTGRMICINCVCIEAGDDGALTASFNVVDGTGTDNNMSNDATAPGTTNYRDVTVTDVFLDPANGDCRWKTLAQQELYPGADLSATVSQARDIEFNAIPEPS